MKLTKLKFQEPSLGNGSSRVRVIYSREMARVEEWRQRSGANNSREQKPQLCAKDAESCPTLSVTFCTLVIISKLPFGTSFSTCPYQISVFVDHEGTHMKSSTLDPKGERCEQEKPLH